MSTINEAPAADRWIHARLTGSPELMAAVGGRIRSEQSRPGEPWPVVIHQALSPGVDVLARTARVMTEMVYVVKAVDMSESYVTLEPIANLIDAALHQQSGTVPGLVVVGCWREGIVKRAETVDGVSFRHLGGRYRLQVHRV